MYNKDIQLLEIEIQKEELQYRLTGDYEKLCETTFRIAKEANELIKESNIKNILCKNKYNNILKYVGDLDLKNNISLLEKEFRKIRKQIPKSKYEEMLKELILMRNRYALTAGFQNYLEYKYWLWGVDYKLLKRKMNKVYNELFTNPSSDDFYTQLKECNENPKLNKEYQLKLLDEVLDIWGVNIKKSDVCIHTENLPDFYIGACVPIFIPKEIHVLLNCHSGLGGLAVAMHEVGHAYYYSHIREELPLEDRNACNLIVEEGIARLFENLVYTPQTLRKLLGKEIDMYFAVVNAFSMYQMCCIEFEEFIYGNEFCEYDIIWQKLKRKYHLKDDKSWLSPHFFVSEPGYFAAYFLGGCMAVDVYRYINNNNINLNEFLLSICRQGLTLNYEELLKLIDF